ncbi:hypothetical protein SteCoe_20172 [Stentor coeruleus]|uniref:Uncharacterized protein n=1 Tax=Stentor coeruleus TaxID=5963 RepID=A0A1R2BSF8_9CILI|nr:hypothetical protein SteCoe_20172 [Stentor coeruleus]
MLKPKVVINKYIASESSTDSIISISKPKFDDLSNSVSYEELSVLIPNSSNFYEKSSNSSNSQDIEQEITQKTCKCFIF